LRLSVTTNADDRRVALASRLDSFDAANLPALQIMSRNFIDPILLEDPTRKLQIQSMLVERIPEWVSKAPRGGQASLIDLIEYALPLTANERNRTILIDARMASFGKSGNFDQLEVVAAQAVQERSAACKPDSCTVKTAEELVTALKNLATAKTEGSARNRLSDITASDKLMLIRTPAEIDLAVQSMKRSVCLQNIYTTEVAGNTSSSGDVFNVEQLCPNLDN